MFKPIGHLCLAFWPTLAVSGVTPLSESSSAVELDGNMASGNLVVYGLLLAGILLLLVGPKLKWWSWWSRWRMTKGAVAPPVPVQDPEETLIRSTGLVAHANQGEVWQERANLPLPVYKTTASLLDLNGRSGRPQVPLAGVELVLGRILDTTLPMESQLVLGDKAVSRRHARITLRNNCHWLEDLNSLNGTFLNDYKITGLVRLVAGDKIRIDPYQFEYHLEGGEAEEILDLV